MNSVARAALAAHDLAAGVAGNPFNIAELTKIVGSFVGLLVAIAGAGVLVKVHSQRNFAAAMGSIVVLIVGLLIVGLSATGKFTGLANSLANAFFV
jgi:hypothetical protein